MKVQENVKLHYVLWHIYRVKLRMKKILYEGKWKNKVYMMR
ncbi:hypothetical protein EH2_03095 [Bacillus subtilis]|nr:hypothetical protein EH2_03095 [Bacillus subtilis]